MIACNRTRLTGPLLSSLQTTDPSTLEHLGQQLLHLRLLEQPILKSQDPYTGLRNAFAPIIER